MLIEVSLGELADKLTILIIKSERITDSDKLKNILFEKNILQSEWDNYLNKSPHKQEVIPHFDKLLEVNNIIWDIEDKIRDCERNGSFDDVFVELARGVYHNNDERSRVKREINELCGSEIVEEKSYTPYVRVTMPHASKLTVMVSIYNSGDWIQNRIENLLESASKSDMEIWCVNANSPDPRDHEIPQRYPVKYIKLDERISVYETWNYIIERSNSLYIANANTDDLVSPNCYNKLMSALDSNPNVGFAYCSWYTTDVPNQKWATLANVSPDGRPGNYAGDVKLAGVGHFPMWKRSLHDKLGLFDTEFQALSDADWWARCYHVGKTKFMWVNELLGTYLWRHGDNLWSRAITSKEWACYHTKVQQYQQDLSE